jgi:hypothetical protein
MCHVCVMYIINDIRKSSDSNFFFFEHMRHNAHAWEIEKWSTVIHTHTHTHTHTHCVFEEKKRRLRNFYSCALCSHYTASRRRDSEKKNIIMIIKIKTGVKYNILL